jgi:hypothetical protein
MESIQMARKLSHTTSEVISQVLSVQSFVGAMWILVLWSQVAWAQQCINF